MYWRKEGKMKVKIGAYKGLIRTLPLQGSYFTFVMLYMAERRINSQG